MELRDEAEVLLGADDGEVVWNDANEKSRELFVKLSYDVSPERWDGAVHVDYGPAAEHPQNRKLAAIGGRLPALEER